MACELMQSGVKVAGVVLIDSPSPFTHSPLPDALIDAVIQSNDQAAGGGQQAKLIDLARVQMRHSTRSLVAYKVPAAARVYPRLVMLRCSEAFDTRAIPGCGPMPFLEDRSDPKASVADWERLTGCDVPVLDIPGHHFEPFHAKHVSVYRFYPTDQPTNYTISYSFLLSQNSLVML